MVPVLRWPIDRSSDENGINIRHSEWTDGAKMSYRSESANARCRMPSAELPRHGKEREELRAGTFIHIGGTS